MKPNMWLWICLLAPLPGLAGLKDATVNPNFALYDEIETVSRRAATGSRAELAATLTRTYPVITNLAVREAITVSLGLNAMFDRQEADAARYREHLRTTYPKSRYKPLLDPTNNLAVCGSCEGKGKRDAPCPTCNGSGKCARCGGKGSFPRMASSGGGGLSGTRTLTPMSNDRAQESCVVCKGAGKCKGCDGRKTVESVCPVCQGTGQVQAGKTRLALTEMLLRLADLAFTTGQIERGRVSFGGKWLDAEEFVHATNQYQAVFNQLAGVAAEADAAENFAVARQVIERAATKFPDEPGSWHLQQLLALVDRDEAGKQTRGKVLEEARLAAEMAVEQIPTRIGSVLDAQRRGVPPQAWLLLPDADAGLPAGPLAWRISPPLLVGRTARAPVVVDLPTRGGLTAPARYMFLLIHDKQGWRIARIDPV